MKYCKGLTLVELMIGLAISSVVAIGVMKAYVGQSVVVVQHARMTQATEDGREAFTIISRLLKQSVGSSITITQPDANNTRIDFMLPSGLPIWPNTTAPYTNNAVRLSWSSQGNDANKIMLSTADPADLAAAVTVPLAGDSSLKNTQVAALSLTDNGNNSYSLSLTSQIGNGEANDPLKVSFEGLVLPRN